MKPEEAVAILNNLDNPTIITVLQKMDEGQAAKILALMNPQRAAVLSKTLLQYHSESNLNTN
jgi:flagellar motility protein MotE (MotC chaperone)